MGLHKDKPATRRLLLNHVLGWITRKDASGGVGITIGTCLQLSGAFAKFGCPELIMDGAKLIACFQRLILPAKNKFTLGGKAQLSECVLDGS